MFVLPDVASTCIAGVELVQVVFSMTDFSYELTETHWIWYCLTNNTLPFLWHIIYISCMNIYVYMSVC